MLCRHGRCPRLLGPGRLLRPRPQRWHSSGTHSPPLGGSGQGDLGALPLAAALGGACGAALLLWRVWPPRRGTLAGDLPTEPETIEAALELLGKGTPLGSAGEELLFVDLGSGDGRMVSAVVRRFGCRGVGVDVLPESVAAAEAAAAAELPRELARRAAFVCADMGSVDLAEADVLFMYLPDVMSRQVVRSLLPQSGLRTGALVLIEDAPEELRHGFGLRHLLRGGVRPTSSRHPALDLFEWRGAGSACLEPVAASPFFTVGAPGGAKVSLRRGDRADAGV